MKTILLTTALLSALGLTACNKPEVVMVPAAPVAVPGPAGPSGATGATGATGTPGADGATGQPGEGTTVNVMPPAASAASN